MNTTGTVAHHLRDLLLTADALLQRGEGQRPARRERPGPRRRAPCRPADGWRRRRFPESDA